MLRQRGNILFLILLTVVLFAALSYAVTSSTQGGGKNAGDESAQVEASQLQNYFASIDAGVLRMMTTGGIRDYELNFLYNNSTLIANYDNSNCTETRCRVFHPNGGGVIGRDLDPLVRTPYGAEYLYYISVPGAGTSATDIVFGLGGVKEATCTEINKKIGITDIPLNITRTSVGGNPLIYNQVTAPTGPIPDNWARLDNLPTNVGLSGTFCACAQSTLSACMASIYYPVVYHVVVAR